MAKCHCRGCETGMCQYCYLKFTLYGLRNEYKNKANRDMCEVQSGIHSSIHLFTYSAYI